MQILFGMKPNYRLSRTVADHGLEYYSVTTGWCYNALGWLRPGWAAPPASHPRLNKALT